MIILGNNHGYYQESAIDILYLDLESLKTIFKYLSEWDLEACKLVCWRFNTLCNSVSCEYRNLFGTAYINRNYANLSNYKICIFEGLREKTIDINQLLDISFVSNNQELINFSTKYAMNNMTGFIAEYWIDNIMDKISKISLSDRLIRICVGNLLRIVSDSELIIAILRTLDIENTAKFIGFISNKNCKFIVGIFEYYTAVKHHKLSVFEQLSDIIEFNVEKLAEPTINYAFDESKDPINDREMVINEILRSVPHKLRLRIALNYIPPKIA